MKPLTIIIAAAALIASVGLASAHAADVTLDYDRDLGAGIQTTGKAIDQSTIGLRFDAPAGKLAWGWAIQVTETGRAGQLYSRTSAHVGYPLDVAGVTVTPSAEAGWAQSLDETFAFGCLRGDAVKAWSGRFSSEAYVRGCSSVPGTVNTAPLNSADLQHAAWSEFRAEAHPLVFAVTSGLSLGLKAAYVTGSGIEVPTSTPGAFDGIKARYGVVGLFARASF